MELLATNIWLCIVFVLGGIGIGYSLCLIFHHETTDGLIVIESTDEEDHERICFNLNMDLDEIKKQQKLIFEVKDETSQKSQFV